jgi:hypothetical protein
MSGDLSKKIAEAIKEKKITPTPRWQFMAKECSIWTIGGILLIIGSLAFSVVLYMTINNDWEIHETIDKDFLGFIVLSFPYFWLVLLLVLIYGGEYYFRHTEKGYKYSLPTIVVGIVTANVIFGTIFYNVGLGRAIDVVFIERVPKYERFIGNRHMRWAFPEGGLLAGRVIEVERDEIVIEDIRGNTCEIDIEEARVASGIEFITGVVIKIIGSVELKGEFKAYKIFPTDKGPGVHHLQKGRPHLPDPSHINRIESILIIN